MPLLLRTIREENWIEGIPHWVPEGDIHADFLPEVRTKKNRLSAWLIQDDRSNLNLVIAAVAGIREQEDPFSYFLIDVNISQQVGVNVVVTAARSASERVSNEFHRDLEQLSGILASRVARLMRDLGERHFLFPQEVDQLILGAYGQGDLQKGRLSQAVKARLNIR